MDARLQDVSRDLFSFTSFNDELSARGKRFELSLKEVLSFVVNNHYSVRHFKYNRRKKKNAQKTKIIILDIDEPQHNFPSLNSIKEKLKPYNHILSTTKSHLIEKNGVICDRYRIILFCKDFIEDSELYKQQILDVANYLSLKCDSKCVDLGRFFYKSSEVISHNFNGKSFEIASLKEVEEKPVEEKESKLWEADSELPKEMREWIDRKVLGKRLVQTREKLIRILIAQKGLLIRFDISQEWLSGYLKIKRDTLSVWFKEIIDNGWLSIANDSYGKGYKAISYRAENELAELIMNYYGFEDRKDSYPSRPLPTEIKDGEWHRTIFLASLKFQNDETDDNFIAWFKTIPGWDKKDRLKKAYNSFNDMKRYFKGLNDV